LSDSYLLITQGGVGGWRIFTSWEDAYEAFEKEEERYAAWLKTLPPGTPILRWDSSLLIKLGETVKVKEGRL